MNINFIDTINSTPRKLGHNKQQLEIERLQLNINDLTQLISQKNNRIDSLNQTLNSLQEQLLIKSQEVSELNNKINEVDDIYKNSVTNLNNSLINKDNIIKCKSESINGYICSLNTNCDEINYLQTELIKYKSLYNSSVLENTLLKQRIDTNTKQLDIYKNEITDIQDKFKLDTVLAQNLQNEISFLKFSHL